MKIKKPNFKKPNIKFNKKIVTIAIIALVVVALIVAGLFIFVFGGDKEPSLEEIIENRAESYKTDFIDSTHQMKDQASVTKYLVNWAENKGIDVTTDQNNNVIYSFDATEGLESRKPTVILCGYDYSCIESYVNSIVSALTLARDENPHGKYTIIFVSEENGDREAGHKIPKSYLEEANEVFYLANDTASKIASSSAGVTELEFTSDIYKASPGYNKAYKVTIAGLPSQAVTSSSASLPNPIKTLGNLLATFKSKSVLFDLVEFTGGNKNSQTPGEASITIVVSEDATSNVESRLDSAIESFNDKYGEKYPEATYSYEVVAMPYEVIHSDVTESLISLLYTAPNGTYFKDDDKNITAFSSITAIDVVSGTAKINVVCSGYDEEKVNEMIDSFQTICALTDIEYKEVKSYPIYRSTIKGTALGERFKESYFEYKTNTLDTASIEQYTMCSAIAEDYPDLVLTALGVTNKTKDNFAGGFIVHLGKLS